MSKFDRKELSPRVMTILKLIEEYGEFRHANGTRFTNENVHNIWDELEIILESEVQKADRYEWLRSQPNDTTAPRIDIVFWEPEDESVNSGIGLRLEEADRKIDEAMKTSN